MPPRLAYKRDLDSKYLVSGPAPPGRVFNYLRRIKANDYSTLIRGKQDDPRNLSHWTVCFMVGLNLVEKDSVPNAGATHVRGVLRLSRDGEKLFSVLRGIRRTFPDSRSSWSDTAKTLAVLKKHPDIHRQVTGILYDSPSLWNLRVFLSTRRDRVIPRSLEFYKKYGALFGIRGADAWTPRNRVPSVFQVATICGITTTRMSRLENSISLAYGSPPITAQPTVERSIRRTAKQLKVDPTDYLEHFKKDFEGKGRLKRRVVSEQVARDVKLAEKLKRLYKSRCQICGDTFKKKDGAFFSEAHHLVPLGKSGDDVPSNIVVLCATCHRKLHYADVRPVPSEPGTVRVPLIINGRRVEIRYALPHFRSLSSAPRSSGP